MLDAMRKQADSILLKGLFVIIVLVFIFWGVGTVGTDRMEVAAKVNDEIITRRQFDRAYQNLANLYRDVGGPSGGPPAEFLRTQAMTQLISNELMLQEAANLGLEVDETELRDSIAAMPNFQNNGRFDKDAYVEILRQNGMKPSDFEDLQREQLLSQKLQTIVARGVQVSPLEVKDRFRHDNERVSLQFVRVPAAAFVAQVEVSDEERKQFYDANQESFREPERVRAVVVEFSPATFAAAVTPSDAEVLAAYEGNLAQYQKPEEVRARHILIKVAPDASEADKAKARKRLEAVLVKAEAGDNFAALAKAHSEDSSAASGGDLGSFGRGVMTPPFEVAAFALAPGAVSEIIETPFGLHIIKVEEKTAARQEPIEAVRASIVESLKTQQARAAALKAVETAHERVLDGEPLEKVAADLSLTVQTPPPFGAGEPVGTLGPRPELAKEAFATDAGEVAEIVTDSSGYSIVKVVERLPTVVPPLEQVRGKVDTEVRATKAAALARTRAEGLLTTLKEKQDLVALAKQEGLTVEESPQIGRAGAYVPNLGNAAALKDAAFALTSEAPVAQVVFDVNGDAVVAVLAERMPADESRFATEQAALTERLQAQAEAAAVRVFLEQLKSQAQIEYGQGFIAAGGGTPLS